MTNALRTLASTIVTTCQTRDNAKRLKQSTVLDVLSKDAGFRSIQAGDAAVSQATDTPAMPDADTIALRGVLYANLPHTDLLPVDLADIILLTTPLAGSENAELIGDRFFIALWDLVSEQGMAAVDEMDRWAGLSVELEEGLELNDDAIQEAALADMPPIVADFIRAEFRERADANDSDAMKHALKTDTLGKFQRDIEGVVDAIRAARSIQDH